jgi:signal transduction histidine kinase
LKERPENADIARELNKDVNRLQLVTDRFGKIGSAPSLEKEFPSTRITEVVDYMSRRMGRQVTINSQLEEIQHTAAMLSAPLFDWVIENLLKNALDAVEGKGQITIKGTKEGQSLVIDITDTGKGMSSNERDSVFAAGYTTKKRGWGLGLSLAKRIIEDYHKGKVFVKESTLEKGTTFRIVLRGGELLS